jgi:glyoxylase-like metal-dependent hydrolase (beta-lactamase superfamily II)
MPEYKVRVLKMGEADVPGPEVYWMSHWFTWETLYFYMVVIQGEGITAIINTGPPEDLTGLNAYWKRAYEGEERTMMRRAEPERPLNALASIGIKPENVEYIFLSPLQSYADGNVSLFPAAKKIFIARRGWIEDFFAPPVPTAVPRKFAIPEDQVIYLTTKALERVHLVTDGEEALPGIKTLWAGVHHRSSLAISIPTRKGQVVVSDSFFKYGNIERNHPLGVNESLEECHVTYERIRREADLTLPLYDPEVLKRFPDGVVA